MGLPKKIGRHRVLSLLGRGAMGEVYKAADAERGDRAIAIKILNEGLAENPHARRRFQREIEITSKIDHPNVVDILEWGEWEGRLWFSMEYLPGKHLGHWIRGYGELDLDTRLAIGGLLCQALEHAHREGVIHRDIKPANVMVDRGDGRLSVKLVDFGIVHIQRSNLTTPKSQPGTYSYMSPEQLRSEPMDHRSDLFSLGIVLYELFARCHPFQAETDPLITDRIMRDEPNALDEDDIPRGVASLLFRILEKDARDRPPTAAAIGRTLTALRSELATVVPEDDPGYRNLDKVTHRKVEQLEALARMRSSEGDYAAAIASYAKIRALAPESERIVRRLEKLEHRRIAIEKRARYLDEARDALEAGETRLARERCEQAWVIDPDNDQIETLRKLIALKVQEGSHSRREKLEIALEEVQASMDCGDYVTAKTLVKEVSCRFPTQTLPGFLFDRVLWLESHSEIDYPAYRMALQEALAELEGDYLESALGATRRAGDLWPEDDEWQALEAQIRERRQGEGERLFAQAREALQKLEGSLDTAEEVDLESRLGNVFQDLDCLDRLKVEAALTEDLRREASALRTELERRRARRVHRQNLVESTTIKYLTAGRERLERSQSLESDGERSWESAIEVYREARQAFRTVLQASDNHAEALRSIEVIESALARLGKQVDENNRRVLEISERVEHGKAQMEEARRLSIDGSSIPALARRLLDDAALSMSRVLELDPDCIDAVVLRDRIEGLQTRLKRRADRQERIRSAVREGLCVGRSELAVAKRLVVPEDEETLRRGQTAAHEAQSALKRVLVVNGTHSEALAMSGEIDSLLEHYRSELMRLREFSRCEHKADGLRVNSRRRIDEWLRTAERTLVDASGLVGESSEDLRVSRAYCAEVDVALQHILWLEPDHLEARRLDEKRQSLLRDLEEALEAADGTRESSVEPLPFVPLASEELRLRSSSVDKAMHLLRIVFWGAATVTLVVLLWGFLQGL